MHRLKQNIFARNGTKKKVVIDAKFTPAIKDYYEAMRLSLYQKRKKIVGKSRALYS